jgi:hypothetical protein
MWIAGNPYYKLLHLKGLGHEIEFEYMDEMKSSSLQGTNT